MENPGRSVEVGRALATRTVDGREAKVATTERVYPTDVADLWNAVTDPERLGRWFLPVEGDLRLGGRYQLRGNAGGTVTACDPPRSFAATWEFGGGIGWIEVDLVETGADRTRLVLRHIAHPEEHWERYGPAATGIGWDLGLLGLDTHVRTGRSNDAAAFEAWSQGPEGLAFIRASGEAWREADVAAGESPDAARERSERTIAFFSGSAQ
ncbi:MAG: SRPBCC family protein [Sporichthyaceae bacterium]